MSTEFTLSEVVSAAPRAVYEAWLDSDGHSAMTGGAAHVSSRVGGAFDAWDGYISGTNLELLPERRIVQTWRTRQFEEHHEDSKIEVTLEAVEGGTRVTIHHTGVPDDQPDYEQGWVDHYLEPMKRHFSGAC